MNLDMTEQEIDSQIASYRSQIAAKAEQIASYRRGIEECDQLKSLRSMLRVFGAAKGAHVYAVSTKDGHLVAYYSRRQLDDWHASGGRFLFDAAGGRVWILDRVIRVPADLNLERN